MTATGPDAGLSAYSATRPLVALTDYDPDVPGGGAVILRSLLDDADRARIAWLTLSGPDRSSGRSSGEVISLGKPGRRSLFLDTTRRARSLAERAMAIARERDARAFWVVMHGAGVPIAAHLVRRGALPVHLTVHDDPAFGVALRSRRYLVLTPWIERQFASAMCGAASVDVIGPGMADRYRRRYGVRCSIVHRGLPPLTRPEARFEMARDGLRVGILGNTYTYGQLPILARAVAAAARSLGVPGRVLVVGRSFGDRLKEEMASALNVEVEVVGHLDEAEGIRRLATCLALYLNYPFPRRDAVLRQTSFPTKLSTYIQAARPILMHAPSDSSIAHLAGRGDYARAWTDLDPRSGATLLESIARSERTRPDWIDDAEAVRRSHYDRDDNRRALLVALNSLPEALPSL